MPIDALLGPCINWEGAKTAAGYGTIRENRKPLYVHRLSFADSRGIPLEDLAGLVIRHKCDNPSCFNPSHLLSGTQADNMRDRIERGRLCFKADSSKTKSLAQIKRHAANPVTEETRARLSKSHLGHKASDATKEKMRKAHLGRKMTDADKEAMRQAWVKRKQLKANP